MLDIISCYHLIKIYREIDKEERKKRFSQSNKEIGGEESLLGEMNDREKAILTVLSVHKFQYKMFGAEMLSMMVPGKNGTIAISERTKKNFREFRIMEFAVNFLDELLYRNIKARYFFRNIWNKELGIRSGNAIVILPESEKGEENTCDGNMKKIGEEIRKIMKQYC